MEVDGGEESDLVTFVHAARSRAYVLGTSGGGFSPITPEGGFPAYAIAGASESRRARGLLGTEERQAPLSRSNPVHAATSPAFALPADSVGVLPPANLQSHFTSGPGFTIWKQETPLGPKTERFSRLHVDTQHLGSTVQNDGGAGQCECTPAMSTLSNPQVSEEGSFANLHVNQGTTCPEGIITGQCECSPAMSTSTGPGGPTSQCTSISQDEFQRPFPSVARSRSASPQSQLTQPALESQSSLTLMSRHVLDRSVSFAAWGAPASSEEQPDGWTPSDSHTPADSQTPSCSGEEGLPGERDISRGGVAALLEEASQTFLSNCHEKRPASKPALDVNSSDEDASLWGDCADEFVESEEEGPALGVGMSFNSWASRSINLDGRAWGLGRQSQFAMDPSLLPELRTTPTGQSGSEAQALGSGSNRRASRGQQAFGSWDWRNGGPTFETSAADWSRKGDAPAELECWEDELLCTEEGGDALDTEQEGAQSIDERLTAQHHDNTEWGGTGVLREQGRSPGTGLRSFSDCMQPVFASGNLEGALSLQDPGLERKGQGSEAKDTTGPALSSKSTGSIGAKRSSESDVERGGDDTSVFAEVEAPCVNRRTPENSPMKRTKAPELGISLDCWLPFKQLVGEAGAGGLKPGMLCGAGAAWGPAESEVESFSAMVDGTDGEGAMVEGDDRQGAIVSTSGAESGDFVGGHRMEAVQAVDRTTSGGFAGRPAATGVMTNLWGDPSSPSSPPAVNREQDLDESPSGKERGTPVEVPPSPSPKPRAVPARENGARTGGPLSPGTKNRWAEGLRKAQGLIGQEGLQGVVPPRKPPRARLWSVKNGFKTLQYKTKEEAATGIVRERRGFGALRLQSSGVPSQPPLLSSRVASGDREDEIRSRVRKLTPEEKAGRPGTGFALYSNYGRGARRSAPSPDCDAQSMDASQSSESIHRSSSPGGAASLGGSEPSTSSGSSFRIRSNARLVRNFSDARSSFQPNLCTIPGTPALPPMPEDSQVDSEGSKQSYSGAVVGAFGAGDAMDSPETPQVPAVQDEGGQECPEAPTGRHKMNRQGSLMDTKLLMTTALKRTQSFFLFDKHFEFLKVIGRGSFSTVYQARDRRSGGLCAIKKSKREFKGRDDRERYLHEIQSVACLSEHPNVVKYYRGWQQEGHFFIQMELCEGGNLKDWTDRQMAPPGEDQIWDWVRQIAAGLQYLHSKCVLHLDIKPENIFLDACGTLKIGDFGLAVLKRQWEWEEGDGAYVAPELLREHEPGPEADLYSFGAMIFEWATGQQLPRSGPEREGEVDLLATHSDSLNRLVRSLLSGRPEARPSAEEVLRWGE